MFRNLRNGTDVKTILLFFIPVITNQNDKESLIKLAPRFYGKSGDGIGADGILLLQTKLPNDPLPYKLTIINSDGSVAMN